MTNRPAEPRDGAESPGGEERRSGRRYPIRLTLLYQVADDLVSPAVGETLNISSQGLLFTAAETIPTDTRLRILIDWPVPSRTGDILKLSLSATVVRSSGTLAAVRVWNHKLHEVNHGSGRRTAME